MNDKKLFIPVGVESYKEILSDLYYVDKTLLIKDILDNKGVKVTLITRPRRFGKTLNLNMLKTFFEKTKEDTSIYFKDKLIWKEGERYTEKQGKYPVIFLTLKDCCGMSFEETFNLLRNSVSKEFSRHYEIVKEKITEKTELDTYLSYIKKETDLSSLKTSLDFLSSILSKVYGRNAIILIDEYDAPIQAGYKNNYYDQIINLMRGFLSSALKTNDYLEFGVLTGVLRVSKESLFSGLNNLLVCSVLDEEFSSFFGFTESEVKDMTRYYDCEDKFDEIKEWYDGYQFGNTVIYNPWSVFNYIYRKFKPKPYWVDTANNDIIGELISKASDKEITDLRQLYEGKGVYSVIDTEVTYKAIRNNEASLLSFLLVTGYLTATGNTDMSGRQELRIPNKEIRGIYQKEIFSGVIRAKTNILDFIQAFIDGDPKTIKKNLEEILLTTVSHFDTHENFYHGFLLGMIVMASDFFEVQSNKEEGFGRFDIRLTPKDKRMKAILIEIKAEEKKTAEELKKLAVKGLSQIEERKYFSSLDEDKCSGILEYGIAFSKKKVEVVSKEVKF